MHTFLTPRLQNTNTSLVSWEARQDHIFYPKLGMWEVHRGAPGVPTEPTPCIFELTMTCGSRQPELGLRTLAFIENKAKCMTCGGGKKSPFCNMAKRLKASS